MDPSNSVHDSWHDKLICWLSVIVSYPCEPFEWSKQYGIHGCIKVYLYLLYEHNI